MGCVRGRRKDGRRKRLDGRSGVGQRATRWICATDSYTNAERTGDIRRRRMRFPYKRFANGILRPIIRINLEYGGIILPHEALLDSGADMCIFHASIGRILGLNIENGKSARVAGVTGTIETFYIHKVILRLGAQGFETDVGFLPRMSDDGIGILGQIGFFDQFAVKFDYRNQEVELL